MKTSILVIALTCVHCALGEESLPSGHLNPAMYIGAELVLDNASVQVVMLDKKGKMVTISLRGISDSQNPELLFIGLDGRSMKYASKESVELQQVLSGISNKLERSDWRKEKLNLLVAFLERDKEADGIDARMIAQEQPTPDVIREIWALRKKQM